MRLISMILFLLVFNSRADTVCFENLTGEPIELRVQRGGRLLYAVKRTFLKSEKTELTGELIEVHLEDKEQYLCRLMRDGKKPVGVSCFFINREPDAVNIYDRSEGSELKKLGDFLVKRIPVDKGNPPSGQAFYASRIYRIRKIHSDPVTPQNEVLEEIKKETPKVLSKYPSTPSLSSSRASSPVSPKSEFTSVATQTDPDQTGSK